MKRSFTEIFSMLEPISESLLNRLSGFIIKLANYQIIKFSITLSICLLSVSSVFAQQVRLDDFGKTIKESKPIRVGGGISANTIFYDGNDGQTRQPFTYFLSGNVNFNLFGQVNLPFTFNFTNLGSNYRYPTLPNRLSVHPTYKWVNGHIGDIAMSFSPYTLNGHMFTGVGVDLAPPGKPIKFSAMAGRLQRKVEYDTANRLVPAAYQRIGYGAKVRYDKEDHFLGMSLFAAKDDASSLRWQPDSLNIFPQGNVAFSWEGGIKLTQNLHLSGEYGLSLLTRDIRAPREESNIIDKTLGNRTSTNAYKAFKTELSYQFFKNVIGVGYERIDPEYKTLGAYFFNNDYENITLRYARPLLNDKVNIAVSWGMQRDDLDNNSEQSSKRFVSSANLDYTPSEKFTTSLSYSGFQTYMNIRSQFDYVNQQTPYDNLDTLNFTQLSQNLASSSTYNFGKNENKKHLLNINVSYQEAADKQGDIIQKGNLSRFFNIATSYGLLFVPQAININVTFNLTQSHIAGAEYLTIGPTVALKAKVFHQKAMAGISASYNESRSAGAVQSEVISVRPNFTYQLWKKHNISANAIWQARSNTSRPDTEALTVTVAYAYNF
jgi:hypothetical protein